jgi:hypothetical protein
VGITLHISVSGTVPTLNSEQALSRASNRVGRLGIAAARRNLLPHTVTGETMRLLSVRNASARGVEWHDRAPQAAMLEEGTRPHIIRPRRAKALRFLNRAGDVIFAKMVRHPGTRARPWLGPAITDNADAFLDIYGDEVERDFGS